MQKRPPRGGLRRKASTGFSVVLWGSQRFWEHAKIVDPPSGPHGAPDWGAARADEGRAASPSSCTTLPTRDDKQNVLRRSCAGFSLGAPPPWEQAVHDGLDCHEKPPLGGSMRLISGHALPSAAFVGLNSLRPPPFERPDATTALPESHGALAEGHYATA